MLECAASTAPRALARTRSSVSRCPVTAITRGVIDLRDLIYFISVMIAFLAANAIIVDLKKAD